METIAAVDRVLPAILRDIFALGAVGMLVISIARAVSGEKWTAMLSLALSVVFVGIAFLAIAGTVQGDAADGWVAGGLLFMAAGLVAVSITLAALCDAGSNR